MLSPLVLQIGQHIGSYRLVRLLGEGGMGVVYEVVHASIGRRAAMKFLTLDGRKHPELTRRFINEARAANQIQHPGVVQIYEFGQLESGAPWMLMEFLYGTTLSERLRALHQEGQVFGRDGLLLLHQLCSVLKVTHEHGIVHRDLKPGNIMLVPDPAVDIGERVKLLDFGIAKLLDDSLRAAGGPELALQTRTGAMLGTPAYMAPEQCLSSAQVDGQADVYAVGVIAYQMFTGRLPYNDEHPLALMAKKIAEPPPPLGSLSDEIPGQLPDLLAALLRPKPAERPTMAQLESSLASMLGIASSRRSGFLGRAVAPPPIGSAGERGAVAVNPSAPANAASAVDTVDAPSGAGLLPANLLSPPPAPLCEPAAPLQVASAEPTAPLRQPGPALAANARTPPVLGAQAPPPPVPLTARSSWYGWGAGLGLLSVLTATAALPLWRLAQPAAVPPAPSRRLDLGSATPDRHPAQPAVLAPPPLAPPATAAPSPALPETAVPPLATAETAAPPLAPPKSVAQHEQAPTRVVCTPISPTVACIRSAALSPQHYELVGQCLHEANIRQCPGERLVLEISQKRVRIKSSARPLSHEVQGVLFPCLVGRLDRIMTQGDIEIRCKGR